MASNVSVVDLAGLSQGAYTGQAGNVPAGYQLQADLSRTDGAMTAQTYMSSSGNIVVVFTGTDRQAANSSQQLAVDRQIVQADKNGVESALAPATAYLQSIAEQFPNSNITVTGHSWGGTEAAYAQQQLQATDAKAGTAAPAIHWSPAQEPIRFPIAERRAPTTPTAAPARSRSSMALKAQPPLRTNSISDLELRTTSSGFYGRATIFGSISWERRVKSRSATGLQGQATSSRKSPLAA